jgi:hypothetical protein
MSASQNQKYSAFNADVSAQIAKANKIYVTIASNEAGNDIVKDNHGNLIEKKLLVSSAYTFPHIDTVTNQQVEGGIEITFSDGTKFSNPDVVTSNWYVVEGVEPYAFKQFV